MLLVPLLFQGERKQQHNQYNSLIEVVLNHGEKEKKHNKKKENSKNLYEDFFKKTFAIY